jgi:hypothetical protein
MARLQMRFFGTGNRQKRKKNVLRTGAQARNAAKLQR